METRRPRSEFWGRLSGPRADCAGRGGIGTGPAGASRAASCDRRAGADAQEPEWISDFGTWAASDAGEQEGGSTCNVFAAAPTRAGAEGVTRGPVTERLSLMFQVKTNRE